MAEMLVARITVGIVWKLFAPYTAQQLEQGDVSEERIRQLLLSEFNKIHEHLNALRRKELLAAVAFLETGFEVLGKDVVTARDEFKKARDAAQMAFGVVPDVNDKILATKILVTSAFYEFQENAETAKSLCSKYTERMNTLPEVVRACEMIFTAKKSIGGKLLTYSGKGKREEILRSVAEVNMSVRNYMKDLFQDDNFSSTRIFFNNYNITPVTDMLLYRKMSVVTEVESETSNFIEVLMQGDRMFAALGNTPELPEVNSILSLNLRTRKINHMLGHTKVVLSICSNDTHLFSSSADKTIIVWDTATLSPMKILTGHEGSVRSVCVSDKYLFSGSSDGHIRVWDIEKDFDCCRVLTVGSPVIKLKSSRKKYIFCMCGISTIQIWDITKFVIHHEINTGSYGRMTVPNAASLELIAIDNTMFIPVKSQDGEAIQCWNMGSLTLSGCVIDSGHNIAKFCNNHYLYCGKNTVKMINVQSYQQILERSVTIGNDPCVDILKMWTGECYLYLLCKTERQRYYIVKY